MFDSVSPGVARGVGEAESDGSGGAATEDAGAGAVGVGVDGAAPDVHAARSAPDSTVVRTAELPNLARFRTDRYRLAAPELMRLVSALNERVMLSGYL
jgi:hypothetical protein